MALVFIAVPLERLRAQDVRQATGGMVRWGFWLLYGTVALTGIALTIYFELHRHARRPSRELR